MQANEKNGSFYLQSKVYRCDRQGAQSGGCIKSDCCSRRRCPFVWVPPVRRSCRAGSVSGEQALPFAC